MSGTLQVGSISVEPGERVMRVLEAPVGDRKVPVPVIAVNGEQPGPRVAITAGIHGAEYVGIEAARQLGMELKPREISGSIVVVPVSNTTAFHARSIYTSGLGGNNLNRRFPGNPEGEPSEQLANWIFRTIIRQSDFYIDLHGGDMIEALVPFCVYLQADDPAVEEASRLMAFATGNPRVISGPVSGSTYGAASAAGIPSILNEIGGQGVWDDDQVAAHREATLRVLRHLGVVPGEKPSVEDRPVYQTFAWLRATSGGLLHSKVRVGDRVKAGQDVGAITDYFGNRLQHLETPATGEVGFLVTSLAMNADDPILAVVGR